MIFPKRHTEWITSDDMRQVAASSTSGFQAADTLHQIGDRLLLSGHSENELCLRQRAVEIAGELCRRDPRRYQRQLASHLRSLGDVLHTLGHTRVALRFLNEAVSLWRSLYKDNWNRSIIMIAWKKTRNVIKTVVRDSVSYLSHAVNASTLVARAQGRPLRANLQISSNFASSLFTLAVVLHDAKRFNDACSADAEGLSVHRELYLVDPDGHRAELSESLRSSAVLLASAGRAHAAVECAQEAVALRQDLSRTNPKLHHADLSGCLDGLGGSLYSLGRFSEAYAAAEEAVALRRQLFEANPNSHCADLSRCLYNLGFSLHSLGRSNEACVANREAVMLQRELFQAAPDQHRQALTLYLNNLGYFLQLTGKFDEACAAAREAVALQQEIFQADPQAHRPGFANYLDTLGVSLHRAQRFSEACEVVDQQVMHYRKLFTDSLTLYRRKYQTSLRLYASVLEADRRHPEAAGIRAALCKLRSFDEDEVYPDIRYLF